MLDSLVNFVPTLQIASIAERLELFRSTLASFEPAEKPKDGGLEEMLDSSVGLDSVILPELPISNSRAGLYIYLNACVSAEVLDVSCEVPRETYVRFVSSLLGGRCSMTTLYLRIFITVTREMYKLQPST